MHLFQRISLTLAHKISTERHRLLTLHNTLVQNVANLLSCRRQQLEMLRLKVEAADPARILGSGFAIVAVGGKRAGAEDIVEGARVKMVLGDGEVEFVVGEIVGKKVFKEK